MSQKIHQFNAFGAADWTRKRDGKPNEREKNNEKMEKIQFKQNELIPTLMHRAFFPIFFSLLTLISSHVTCAAFVNTFLVHFFFGPGIFILFAMCLFGRVRTLSFSPHAKHSVCIFCCYFTDNRTIIIARDKTKKKYKIV